MRTPVRPLAILASISLTLTASTLMAEPIGWMERYALAQDRQAVLAELGVPTGQLKGHTGVWVQPNVASRCINCPPALLQAPSKIASIGVKVDAKGISRHGFALNVATDMRYWDGILACGLDNQNQISLTQILNSAPNMQQVIDKIVQAFSDVFEYEISIEDEIRQP